eukprot:gene59355-biopygen49316
MRRPDPSLPPVSCNQSPADGSRGKVEADAAALVAPALIGVFDSGVGGLSVLAELRRQLPEHPLLYVADSAHAPYGDQDAGHVQSRALAIGHFLRQAGAGMVVVACNTATAIAIEALRRQWPAWALVGV